MATDPDRQGQHLVSRGLQKNFAPDHRVAILDAQSGAMLDPRRPITSNWRVDDFLTVVDATGDRDQSLEREFAKTEGKALDQIRRITLAKITREQRRALDLLAAIHLVRSLSFVAVHGQVTDAFFDNYAAEVLADSGPQLLELFMSDSVRRLALEELEFLIDAQARKFQASPDLTASGMRRVNAGIPGLLGRYRVQLVEASFASAQARPRGFSLLPNTNANTTHHDRQPAPTDASRRNRRRRRRSTGATAIATSIGSR